jgi:nucleotide-binding universal stress UspA family protein
MASTPTRGDAARVMSKPGGDMTGSIVCGVDGSRESRSALRVAAQLSGQLGLRLVAAHVVPVAVFGGRGTGMVATAPAHDELYAGGVLLEQIRHDEGLLDAEQRVTHGFPAERLADLADEEEAELIVVGSRGRGAVKAAFLGSTSMDLIGVARRPVLVVPPGAVEATSATPRTG